MERRDFLKGSATLGLVACASGRAAAATAGEGSGDASAQAMRELAETIAELENGYVGPERAMRGPDERAAGRYSVMHALLHGFQYWFEADPARPLFHRWHTLTKKVLGDNPDALYYGTVIDPARSYRIRSNVTGAAYTSYTTEGGTKDGHMSTRLASTLNDTQFDIAADGSYEIIASPEPPPGASVETPRNWLRLAPDSGSITTRHYYEWERSAAADPALHVPIMIEPLNDPGPAPIMDDQAVVAGIRRVIHFVRGVTIDMRRAGDIEVPWVSREPNVLRNPTGHDGNLAIGYAARDNVYRQAPYQLGPNEALEIRGRFPRCRFANVMVWNHHMQTPPYPGRRVSLNRRQVRYESDGSFRIVIAHRNPGVPNWIDTGGAPSGTIFWRIQLPEEELAPLRTRVYALS